jgi:hypothetical protein
MIARIRPKKQILNLGKMEVSFIAIRSVHKLNSVVRVVIDLMYIFMVSYKMVHL